MRCHLLPTGAAAMATAVGVGRGGPREVRALVAADAGSAGAIGVCLVGEPVGAGCNVA